MPAYTHHAFVCTNVRPPDNPKGCCAAKGSPDIVAAFKAALERHGLHGTAKVTSSGCLGPCARGVTMVVYPEGTWYGGVTLEDVDTIVREHFVGGTPVARLVMT